MKYLNNMEHEREYGGVYNSCYQRVRNCCDRVSPIGVNEIDEFWLPDGMSDHRINYLFLIYEDTYVKNKVEALPTAYAKTKVDDKLWYSTYWTRDSVWPGPVRYLNSYNQNKAYAIDPNGNVEVSVAQMRGVRPIIMIQY